MIDEFKIKLVFETEEKTEIVEEKTEIKKNSVFLLLFFKKNIMLKK